MTSEPGVVETPKDAPPSALGAPGLTWAGDGALGAGRAPARSPIDVEFEIYPPVLDEGDKGYPLATFNRRWVGFVIDFVTIIACASVVSALVAGSAPDDASAAAQWLLIVTLIRIGYGLIFNPRGWSPGKLVVGLRIVKVDGEPPGLRWGVIRTAATEFSAIAYLGYIWAYFDKRTQTVHDKFAHTYVVHVEAGDSTAPNWRRR